uniref:Glucose-6-phosphate isomerase n=1 Tax=Strongyloides venezuelensis TaxID=75913 RepID=A0A0K0F208_STRVS
MREAMFREEKINFIENRAVYYISHRNKGKNSLFIDGQDINKDSIDNKYRIWYIESNIFAFWDWIGCRYSLLSAISLSIAIFIGFDYFEKILQDGHFMDKHFKETPLENSIPVILAVLCVGHINFFGCETYALLLYYQYLQRFCSLLPKRQLLDSNQNLNEKVIPEEELE